MKKEFYDHILQGDDATEKNAHDHARGIDWMDVEKTEQDLPNLDFIDSVNGIDIWYDFKGDYYLFSDSDGLGVYDLKRRVRPKTDRKEHKVMEDFKKDSLVENYNRIVRAKNRRLDEAGMFFGSGFVEEDKFPSTKSRPLDRDAGFRNTDMVSDIQSTWNDGIEIQQDVREFLIGIHENRSEDFEIDDMIDAIENGIRDFRKITNT